MNGQLHCNTGTLQVHTVVNLQLIVKCWTCYILTNVYLVEILVIPTVFGCYRYVSLGGEQLLSLVWYVCERERERACLFAVLRLSVWAVFLYQCTCCSEMSCFSYRICIYIITAPSCKVYTSVYPGPGQPWLHICLCLHNDSGLIL